MVEDRDLERLKEVVAAYGASPERWPQEDREHLEELAVSSRGAPWMAEAGEIDLLLSAVPRQTMSAGLAANIVSAARTTPQALPERVVQLQPARRRVRAPSIVERSGQAAFLAASLVAGIWFGANDQIETLINGEPLGLAAMVPGVQDQASLSTIVWDAFNSDESLP